jgi:glycosyltransferase involved in cell wall biosynthesis
MKVFPYLAAGRPILAPALPDIGEVLQHNGNAWLVPPDDPAAAAEGLRRVLGDAGMAERLAASALATSAGLTWDARANALVTRYRQWLAALDRARPHRRHRAPV